MEQVGVDELGRRAAELLRHVRRGESYEITVRGRPVAVLVPVPTPSPETGAGLARLRAAGQVRAATASLDDLPDPLEDGDARCASDVLRDLRRDER